jgi:hypothetical protein
MIIKPSSRNVFLGAADELNYLSDVIKYFSLEEGVGSEEAQEALGRFEKLLKESGVDNGSIILQDHWALLYEVRADLRAAVTHRKREIELIDELMAIGGPVDPINHEFLRSTIRRLCDDYALMGEQENVSRLLSRLRAMGGGVKGSGSFEG